MTLQNFSLPPVRVSGLEYEPKKTMQVLNADVTEPNSKQTAQEHLLNWSGTRSISVWLRPDGRATILEKKPLRWKRMFEIVHHDVTPGQEYVFRQFPILERWGWTRKLQIGAKVRIFQAIS